jgi:uncharacterized protein YdeI (YjbR/CyaY-like superfamily)
VRRASRGADESAPRFFESAAQFRAWLDANHASAAVLWIGFYKAHTRRGGLTYPEAVEEALCYGWIDGLKKRLDDDAFVQRFTPRRATSMWSAINLRKVERLVSAGRMHAAGLAVYEARDPRRALQYSFERTQPAELDAALARRFRANRAAWRFFESQPPGYRRVALHWVMSAKKPETRAKRLDHLIAESARALRLPALAGAPRRADRDSARPRRGR